jgi:hypothetical protein
MAKKERLQRQDSRASANGNCHTGEARAIDPTRLIAGRHRRSRPRRNHGRDAFPKMFAPKNTVSIFAVIIAVACQTSYRRLITSTFHETISINTQVD